MNRARVLFLLLAGFASTAFAQHSITLASPTSGQVIQNSSSGVYGQWPTLHPTATVTDSSGNSTAYVLYLFNGKPFADNVNTSYVANTGDPNWTATFNPALWGDGTGTMQAISFDIFGNQLAASSIVSFQLRASGGTQGTMSTVQTSGIGLFQAISNVGIGTDAFGGSLFIDGRGTDNEWQSGQGGWSGGSQVSAVKTNRFLNGPHEVMFATAASGGSVAEPLVVSSTFTDSGVSGTAITTTGHFWKNLEPVCLSTTGVLPSPLVAGTCWYWTTSSAGAGVIAGNANTFTVTVSSGVMTITTNSAHGASPGTPVYMFNLVNNLQNQSGNVDFQPLSNVGGAVQICDGLYTAVSPTSGTTITLNTPSCPNQSFSVVSMEMYINPYFTNYIDNSTVSLSASPGGTPISLNTSGASGTHTILGRPFWNPQTPAYQRTVSTGPLFFAYQNVTFSNGTTPMELRPAFAEMHGVAGTTGPSLCTGLMGATSASTGSMIFNTDGTSTSIPCNALTYTVVNDFVSGAVSVDAYGNPTYNTPGWAHIVVACPSCAPAGPGNTFTVTGSQPWSAGTATLILSGNVVIPAGQNLNVSGITPSGYNGTNLLAVQNIYTGTTAYTVSSNPGTYSSGGTVVSTYLPSVTVWIQVHSGSVTFPHFTVNGVTSTYVPGQSLFPRTMWNLDTINFLTSGGGCTSPTCYPLYQQSMMQLANINAVQNAGLSTNVADPLQSSPCQSYPVANDTLRWNWMASHPYVRTEQNWISSLEFSQGYYVDAYLNNVNYPTGTRAACWAGYWASVKANGKTYVGLSYDEVNQNFGMGLLTHDFTGAGPNSFIGSTFFNTLTTNSSGVATITGQFDIQTANQWNQSTGLGEYIKLTGSSIGSLNGLYPAENVTNCLLTNNLEGLGCSMTIPTSCISCTQTSTNDPNLQLIHWKTTPAARTCVVPILVGVGGSYSDQTSIGWGGRNNIGASNYAAGTRYIAPGGATTTSATESAVQVAWPVSTLISTFNVSLNQAPGAGVTATFTFRDNATSQAVTCAVSGASATTCSDSTHSFTPSVSDLLDIQMVVSGGAMANGTSITMNWVGGGGYGPTSVVSDGASPSNFTITWPGHKFTAGQVLHIWSATNTGLNVYGVVANVATNTFTVVAFVQLAAGTYNLSTDANALFTRDCDFANNTYSLIRAANIAANAPPQIMTITGTAYGRAYLTGSWPFIGNPSNVDGVLRYHADSGAAVYGYDASVSQNTLTLNNESLFARPWQTTSGPLGDLFGSGGCQGAKFHQGYTCDFRYDRIYSVGNMRPENIAVTIGHLLSTSGSHLKLYLWNGNQISDAAAGAGGQLNGTAINPQTNPVQWAAWSQGFAFLQMESKYLLQPQMNTPYLGPMFATSAHTSSFGNILTIACENETPYPQTVNLTPFQTGGSYAYRVSLTAYRLTVTPISATLASDSYNFCGHGPGGTQSPGETVAYVFQASGMTPDLISTTFSAPATLPFGATKYLIRYGYYAPAMAANQSQDPGVDCTNGCTIPINNTNVNAFYQTILADSSYKLLSSGSPIMLPAPIPNP